MLQYTKDDVARAIIAIKNGLSTNKASKEWGIPYTTLLRRLDGGETHYKAAESQ